MSNEEILSGLMNFAIIAVICIGIIALILNILCKKFVLNDKKIKFYGLFLNLGTKSLIAISSLSINFIFLVWWTLTFKGINVIFIVFSLILMLIADIILENSKGVFLTVILSASNCLLVYVTYLLYNYIKTTESNIMLFVILVLITIFSNLYYAFNLFRMINNIVIKNKHIKKKTEYKV